MRTVSRLRLLFLVFTTIAVVLSTLLLFALSKLCRPIRSIITFLMSLYAMGISIILLVDLGGFAPPSRTLFSLLHTAITYIVHYLFLFVEYLALIASKNTRSSWVNSTKSICSLPPRAKFSSWLKSPSYLNFWVTCLVS